MGFPEVAIQLLQEDGEEVAMSWKRAANFVNALRRGHARPELPLYATGCEGEVDSTIRQELIERFG